MEKFRIKNMQERRKKLVNYTSEVGCNSLVTFEPENLFYLTGFWGEAIGVLDRNGNATIIAPELEVSRAKNESIDCDIITTERGSALLNSLSNYVKKSNVCVDCQNYSMMESLKKSIPKIKNSSEPFNRSRIIKDENEISILKKASKIIDQMYRLCTKEIKVGVKESELQTKLMAFAMSKGMFSTGYRSTLNPLIIASGPNGALPHAQVTNRKFRNGDLIVVDITLRYKGYVSDATRTFGLGKISQEAERVYEIVKDSQKLGLLSTKSGVSCRSVDESCRTFIQEKNYGDYFIHSTGHGIGIDVHESPNISYRSTTQLEKNMAITIEPGIYIPNKFGVRIEDSVIVKDKPILLHNFTKDLLVL